MADRQDIDALLIGALYGELTPADEARLATHLDSHPDDRQSLAGMTMAREAVRSSRILATQTEPPQAVSALLLQEAARRAPKMVRSPEAREGWFQRFVRSFVAHPAMAAAASLVLVVGVAGALYLKNGDTTFVERTAQTSAAPAVAPATGAVAAMGSASATNEKAMDPSATAVAAAEAAAEPRLADEAQRGHGASAGSDAYQVDLDQGAIGGAKGGLQANAQDGKDVGVASRDRAAHVAAHAAGPGAPADVAKNDVAFAGDSTVVDGLAETKADRKQASTGGTGGKVGQAGKDRYVEVSPKPSAQPLDSLDPGADKELAAPVYATPPMAKPSATSSSKAKLAREEAGPASGGGGVAAGVATSSIDDGREDDARRQPAKAPTSPTNPAKKTVSRSADAAPTAPTSPTGGASAGMPGAAAPPVQQAPAAPRVQNKPAAAPAPTAAPPPPPARPATVTADKAAKPDAANSPKAEAADATTTWAKHEHDRLRKLVSTGSCAAAAKVAVEIANRAPEYYAQNVANSRDVRQCQQYLDSARDKDAEATGKNRAKHTSPDEPAAATH